jgi:hypothetical protein
MQQDSLLFSLPSAIPGSSIYRGQGITAHLHLLFHLPFTVHHQLLFIVPLLFDVH